jgi:hypothetical protein
MRRRKIAQQPRVVPIARLAAAATLIMVLASNSRADLKDVKVGALVDGKQQDDIGRLFAPDVTIKGDDGAEGAVFKLNDAFKSLMNDDKGCQFRWFQVITQHDQPPFWKGAPPPSYPFVDGPSGGWDYQRDPPFKYKSGTPGGDTAPFYENDDDFKPNKNSYSLYKDVHDASKGTSMESDGPGLPAGASTVAKFQSYLVFVDAAMRKAMEFDVLIGFSWEIGRDKDKKPYAKGPTLIDKIDVAFLNKAMEPSGFKGWEAKTGLDIGSCYMPSPEPDSLTIAALGSLGIVVFGLRKHVVRGSQASN